MAFLSQGDHRFVYDAVTSRLTLLNLNNKSGRAIFSIKMEDYRVSSELYVEFDYTSNSVPTVSKDNAVSRFKFDKPPVAYLDSDGDFVVARKPSNADCVGTLEIEHSKSTELNLVGLQVWRGALLLADWLIYNGKSLPETGVVLELASGVGLTSIVAAMYSPVVCSDISKGGILELIKSNVERNKAIIKHGITVIELDFFSENFSPDIEHILEEVEVILAADVVYDDVITEAFVNTLRKLLSTSGKMKTVYIALEKRYVFTISDFATCAPCYEHFLECLRKLDNVGVEELPLDFPQYFQYDRTKELVLWKVCTK